MAPDTRTALAGARPGGRWDGTRLALVLWNGGLGGAETLTAALAGEMRRHAVDAHILMVGAAGPLAERLAATGVPWSALDLPRGATLLRRPRAFAAAVAEAGPDGALLASSGYMGACLRIGGYAGPVIAVEHGILNQIAGMPLKRRLARRLDRRSGTWAHDAEVAVSAYMAEMLARTAHARRVVRIDHGVDLGRFRVTPPPAARRGAAVTAGFAGRLVAGKGVDDLIAALPAGLRLRVAGDGPERAALERRAAELGVADRVEFVGWAPDIAGFWSGCDMAVIPSSGLTESFGMSAVEAMACGRPVVAAGAGALPEVVAEGATGALYRPGDVEALRTTLAAYADDPDLRHRQGAAARERAERLFAIERCAEAYLEAFAAASARRA